MDTNNYFWLPTNPQYTTKRSKEERLALMKKDIIENKNVVISCSLVDWVDELIQPASLSPLNDAATVSLSFFSELCTRGK